jgi:site-specific recombinase XerD
MQRALQLQGKAEKTVEAYARAVRRSADFFRRCPDDLTAEELQTYYAALLKSHSCSRVKLDRCGLPFFYRYVLKRPWDWTEIVKPPCPQRLPDVLTREETLRLLGTVRKLRYRVFFATLYSTGLRLSEGLALEVGDPPPSPTALSQPHRWPQADASGQDSHGPRRGVGGDERGGGRCPHPPAHQRSPPAPRLLDP